MGIGLIAVVLFIVFTGPILVQHPPKAITGGPNSPPSLQHPFGTDYLGHDVFNQIAVGAYPSLLVGIVSATGATLLGFWAGLFSGFYHKVEPPLSGATDVVLIYPHLVLLIVIGSIFLATNQLIIGALILVLWALCARAIRAQVLSIKTRPYVDAARTSGFTNWQIIWKIIAPEVVPIGLAYFVLQVSTAIILVTSLEFIGIGNPNEISWGSMLFFAQQYGFYLGDWWWILTPGLFITLISTGFALIGFSFEEVMNPRLRI